MIWLSPPTLQCGSLGCAMWHVGVVPRPCIEPAPPALEAQSLSHWAASKPCSVFLVTTASAVSLLDLHLQHAAQSSLRNVSSAELSHNLELWSYRN